MACMQSYEKCRRTMLKDRTNGRGTKYASLQHVCSASTGSGTKEACVELNPEFCAMVDRVYERINVKSVSQPSFKESFQGRDAKKIFCENNAFGAYKPESKADAPSPASRSRDEQPERKYVRSPSPTPAPEKTRKRADKSIGDECDVCADLASAVRQGKRVTNGQVCQCETAMKMSKTSKASLLETEASMSAYPAKEKLKSSTPFNPRNYVTCGKLFESCQDLECYHYGDSKIKSRKGPRENCKSDLDFCRYGGKSKESEIQCLDFLGKLDTNQIGTGRLAFCKWVRARPQTEKTWGGKQFCDNNIKVTEQSPSAKPVVDVKRAYATRTQTTCRRQLMVVSHRCGS